MPKNSRSRRKREDKAATSELPSAGLPPPPGAGEEDIESVSSSQDGSAFSDDGGGGGGAASEDQDREEELLFQLSENLDQLSERNSRTRMASLLSVNKLLCTKVVTPQLIGRIETVTDTIGRSIKKVRGSERLEMLRLAMLASVQVSSGHTEPLASLGPLLAQILSDSSVSANERVMCVQTLGMCVFGQSQDMQEVVETMHDLEKLFSCGLDIIRTAAVRSWTLLLSIAPSSVIEPLIHSVVPVLNGLLLQEEDMNTRIVAGQAVALLFELTRDLEEDLLDAKEMQKSEEVIQELASESSRYTARKERKQQRSCFRDVAQSLDDGSVPERQVKCSMEVIDLNSWGRLIQYDAFREVLGPGMNHHLQRNELLREVFSLGPVPIVSVAEKRVLHMEQKYYNAAMAKHRSQSRGKQRDKRSIL